MNNQSREDRDRQVMELWQNQETEGVRMSVDQVRLEAGRFHRKIRGRNVREYVAAVAVIVFSGYKFSQAEDLLVRIGFGLLMAGMAYLVWHLLSQGSPRMTNAEAGLSSWIELRRRELVRQRDLLLGVWRWYLGPLIPGLVVLVAAFGRYTWSHGRHWGIVVLDALIDVAVFSMIGRLNAKAAQKLQRQIDELDQQSLG